MGLNVCCLVSFVWLSEKRNIKPYADFNQRTLDFFFFFCVTWRKNEKIVPEGQAVPIAREEGKKGLLRKVDKLTHLVFLAQSLWFLVPFHTTPTAPTNCRICQVIYRGGQTCLYFQPQRLQRLRDATAKLVAAKCSKEGWTYVPHSSIDLPCII